MNATYMLRSVSRLTLVDIYDSSRAELMISVSSIAYICDVYHCAMHSNFSTQYSSTTMYQLWHPCRAGYAMHYSSGVYTCLS